MSTLYPNSGALFPNDKKINEKSPDFQGDVQVEVSLLKELMKSSDNGLVKLRLGGWRKESSRGWFVSLKVSAPMQPKAAPVSTPDENVPF